VFTPFLVVVVLFTLDVHHGPRDQEEHERVHQKAEGRRAAVRTGERLAQETARQDVRLRVGDDEESQCRDDGNRKLLFLLFAVASAAAILEESHCYTMG